MKRLIALLALSLLLVFASCGANSDSDAGKDTQSAQGAGDGSAYEAKLTESEVRNHPVTSASDFEYEVLRDHVEINKYLGDDPIVVIPEIIEDKYVTYVDEYIFANDSPVRGVYFPESMQGLIATFTNNRNVEVVIYDGTEGADDGAFMNCEKLHTVVLNDTITILGDYTFSNCDSLTELYLSPNLIEIGWREEGSVFSGSDNLTIKGAAGSAIEAYCAKYKIPFEAV